MNMAVELNKNDHSDENSTLDGSIFTIKSDTPMLDGEKSSEIRYGWWKFTPNFLQKLNNTKWLLACLSICAICQSMLINAFIPVAITTLEKRFQFSAFQLGLFVACYDVAIMLVQMPVCYFGEKGHKSRWLAMGMFLMALGSGICIIPQFISGIYTYDANVTQQEVCHDEQRLPVEMKYFEKTVLFYVFFIGGQVLHGIGGAPLYTLGVTYLNENVRKDSSPMYLGVFFGCSVLGPAIGYIIGGFLLRIYGDVWKVDIDMIKITHEDVRWYGAWWILFMISSGLAGISSIVISGFGRKLPNAPEHHEMDIKDKITAQEKVKICEGQISDLEGFGTNKPSSGWKSIHQSLKRLLKCRTWIYLLLVDCFEGLPSTGIVAFFPKILENFFLLSSSTASLFTGCAIVPAAFVGNVLGGYISRKYHLQVSGMLSFALFFDVFAYFSILAFLAQCTRPALAGITVPYGYEEENVNTHPLPSPANLSNKCNENCHCSKTLFNPVCDSNRSVVYYSPCFAGCQSKIDGVYKSCSCLIDPYANSTSTFPSHAVVLSDGFCAKDCDSIIIFLVIFTVLVFTSFMTAIPIQESQLRTVPFDLRTFAFGIRWIIVRIFGTIPGPMLFGYLVDQSCLLWIESAGKIGRSSKCVVYNNRQLGNCVIAGGMFFKTAVLLFLFLARRSYLKTEEKAKKSAGSLKSKRRESAASLKAKKSESANSLKSTLSLTISDTSTLSPNSSSVKFAS